MDQKNAEKQQEKFNLAQKKNTFLYVIYERIHGNSNALNDFFKQTPNFSISSVRSIERAAFPPAPINVDHSTATGDQGHGNPVKKKQTGETCQALLFP